MLKQCIENEIDLILIDNKFSGEYKRALNRAQVENDDSDLTHIFKECQDLISEKLEFLRESIEYINKYNIQSM